jgi:hypothetical protein
VFLVAGGPPPNHGFEYRDIVATARRSGELVMTGTVKFQDGKWCKKHDCGQQSERIGVCGDLADVKCAAANTLSTILLMALMK